MWVEYLTIYLKVQSIYFCFGFKGITTVFIIFLPKSIRQKQIIIFQLHLILARILKIINLWEVYILYISLNTIITRYLFSRIITD